MSLAYTAPTWEDGSGTGISASQLQAISNCIEGLVQGIDKAVHAIVINGSTITLTYADGTQETSSALNLKGIVSIEKTSTSGLVDTYTITYTDGTTSTFTVTNGTNSPNNGTLTIQKNGTTVQTFTANQESNATANITTDEWHSTEYTTLDGTTVTFSGLNDTYGYELYCEDKLVGISAMTKTGSGTSVTLAYTVTGASVGDKFKLRIIK